MRNCLCVNMLEPNVRQIFRINLVQLVPYLYYHFLSRVFNQIERNVCGKPPRKWLRKSLSSHCIKTSLVALVTIVKAFRSSQTSSVGICHLGYLAQLLCSYLYELLSRLPH
jgi:hypothetical protein